MAPGFTYRSTRGSKRHIARWRGYKKSMYRPMNAIVPRYRRNLSLSLRRSKLVFPTRKFTKLHSYILPSLTSTTGSFASLQYPLKLNFPGDPQGTGGSAQPRYFKTLFGADDSDGVYLRGHCYGVKVTAVFVNAEKIGDVGLCCYDSQSTAPNSFQELGERPFATQKCIDPATGTHTQVRLTKFFNFAKMVGLSKKQYLTEDEYEFQYATSPAHTMLGQIFYQAYGAQTSSVNVKLYLTFYVKCEQLADVETIS